MTYHDLSTEQLDGCPPSSAVMSFGRRRQIFEILPKMPHTTGSILTLIALTTLFVSTSSYYMITIGLRLLGWYLLRKSETRRQAVLDELVEKKKKHGGGVMKKEEALVVGFFHPFWCAESSPYSFSDSDMNLPRSFFLPSSPLFLPT